MTPVPDEQRKSLGPRILAFSKSLGISATDLAIRLREHELKILDGDWNSEIETVVVSLEELTEETS